MPFNVWKLLRQRRSRRVAKAKAGSGLRSESLEARVLFSADLPWVSADSSQTDLFESSYQQSVAPVALPALQAAPVNQAERQNVVVLDPSVLAYSPDTADSLQHHFATAGFEVAVLAETSNAFGQLSELLAGGTLFGSIDVLTTASTGGISLGGETLGVNDVLNEASAISGWADRLDDDSTLNVQAIGLEQFADAQHMAELLVTLTGADVAFSSLEGDITTAVTPPEQHTPREVVFVDSSVADYQALLDDILESGDPDRTLDVFLLDSARDGVQQISEILQGYKNLDAIHIVSHGGDGEVYLGDGTLSGATLGTHSAALEGWRAALSEEADLLIYGCDLAASEIGEALIAQVADLTGADVAASDDLTGASALGGDWELEFTDGAIEAELAFSSTLQRSWNHVLATTSESLVNETTTGNQESNFYGGGSVAADANGNYVVIWQDNSSGSYDIYGRLYNADGTPSSSEFLINSTTVNDQRSASVAMGTDGDFVVTWTSYDQDSSNTWGVYAQRFDASGVSQGAELQVNTGTVGDQLRPKIGMDDAGNFAITFTDMNSTSGDVVLQRYAADGTLLGSNSQINTTSTGSQGYSDIAVDGDTGNIVLVWESLNQDGDQLGVYARLLSNSGANLTGEIQVNQNTTGDQQDPKVDVTADGGFVVAWGTGTAEQDIAVRQYDATGTAITSETIVNTTTVGNQFHGDIAASSNGQYLVTWVDDGNGGNSSIQAQLYAANGSKIGSEVQINETVTGYRDDVSVTLVGGTATFSWWGEGAGDTVGVFARSVQFSNVVAEDDSATAISGTPAVIDVLSNDSDADGDPLVVLEVSDPVNGSVVNNGDGTVTYTSSPGYTGSDSFTYIASDSSLNLQNYWALDGDASDSVGAIDGTLNGTATVAAEFGNGLAFNESSDYVQLSGVSYAAETSISFDFKLDDNSGSLFQYLYSHGDVNNTNNINVFVNEASHGTDPNVLRTVVRDGDDTLDNAALQVDIAALVGDGEWHNYTVTTGSAGLQVYIDGELVATDATRGTGTVNPSGNLYLGARQDLVADRFYGGALDSLSIYGSALTAREVADLHSANDRATVNVAVEATEPTDIQVVATSAGGTSLNQDGGNSTYLLADNGSALLGNLTSLTYETRYSTVDAGSQSLISYATTNNDNEFKLVTQNDGNLLVQIGANSIQIADFDFLTLADGEAHTLSFSWQSSDGGWALYVDGVEEASGTGLSTGYSIEALGALVLGNEQDAVGADFDPNVALEATIFDARLFSDVRTAAEVSASYRSDLPFDEASMLANWQFDGLSSDGVITDAVSGNNLTVNDASGVGFTASEPVLTFLLNENSLNGTMVGQVAGVDAERLALIDSLLAADPDLHYNAETDKFYKVDDGWYTPTDARTNAESTSLNGVTGQLLTIRSAGENAFITDIVSSIGASIWLGATDATVEGEWRWIDSGSEADQFWEGVEDGSSVDGSYQNWVSGSQPNQLGGEEDWARLDTATGQWWDDKVGTVHHYVAEWDADTVLDATQALTYSIEAETISGAFAIDASTGQISVADGSLLDYETNTEHTLTIRATDVDSNTFDETFTVALNDLTESNSAPTDLSSGIELNTDGGNDAYLRAADGDAILGGLDAFTFEMVVQFEGTPTDPIATLIKYTADSSPLGNSVIFNAYNNGTLALNIENVNFTAAVAAPEIFDGEVHHLAVAWDNTNGDVQFYVDGELLDQQAGLHTGSLITDGGGTAELDLGQYVRNESGTSVDEYPFYGTFYDVRIWDEVRSEAEISLNYQNKFDSASLPDGLVANWQMDGFNGSSEVVDVVSGNNLSIGHATGGGFTASTPVEDLHISENANNGDTVDFVVPSDPDVSNDVVNDGLFLEESVTGSFTQRSTGSSFGGWTVESGTANVYHDELSYEASPLGGRSVELGTAANPATISQSLTTVVGQQYQIVFAISGDWTAGDDAKDLRVSAGGSSDDFVVTESDGWSATNRMWEHRSFTFTADSTNTRLAFETLEFNAPQYGAVIADVQVIEIPAAVTTILNNDPTLSYDAATGKFYQAVNSSVDFATAVNNAQASALNGVFGQLITINSEYENNLALGLRNSIGDNIWLGATDETVEGEWRWLDGDVDGDQFWSGGVGGSAVGGNYTNWNSAVEPNNAGGNEDSAYMRSDGLWNDTPVSSTASYVIEWDASEVLSNFTFSLTDDADGRFAIDQSTGEITVADSYRLDYENATSHDVDIQVTDAAGNSYTETMTITIDDAVDNNPNNAPTDLSSGIELNTDGGNDAYLVANNGGAILGGLDRYTIEFNFSTTDNGNLNLLSYYVPSASTAADDELRIAITDTGILNIHSAMWSHNMLASDYDFNQLRDGDQHHLAVSWDNVTGSRTVYVDGEQVGQREGSLRIGETLESGGVLVFGNEQDSLGGGLDSEQAFHGTLYDVRIWDEVRSEAEISLNYQNKFDSGSLPDGLVANWQMDGFNGSNEVVDVVSGNNLSVEHVTVPLDSFTTVGGVTTNGNSIFLDASTAPGGYSSQVNSEYFSSLGYTDDYTVSFTLDEIKPFNFMIGLGLVDSGAGYSDIDHAFYFTQNGDVFTRQNGAAGAGTVSNPSAGDEFSFYVNGTTVEYQHNGVTFHSETITANSDWYLDSSFTSQDDISISNFQLIDGNATGFVASTPVEDLHISENASNGTSIGYVVPSDPDIANDVVSDGLFREAADPGAFQSYAAPSSFGDWTVESGEIELLGTVFADSPLGGRSVDLNESSPGTISQTLTVEPGKQYQVIFALTGNHTGGESTKDIRVSVDGQSAEYTHTSSPEWSTANPLWDQRSLTFTADDTSAVLRFASLDAGVQGAIIADIQVVEIPAAVTTILNDDPTLSYDAATNKFYRFVNTPGDFNTQLVAATTATLNGISGGLVRIDSAYENELVRQFAIDGGNDIWLGATDANNDGNWNWLDVTVESSDQFWTGGTGGSATTGFYVPTFLQSASAGEDYLRINSDGAWVDDTPGANRSYVVQWDASEVLSSFTFSLTDDAGGRFAIDSATGEVTVANGSLLDYETFTSHDIDVQVLDAAGNSYVETMAIAIDNGIDPTQSVPGPQNLTEATPLTFSSGNSNAVTVTDTLASTDTLLQVSLSVSDGYLTLSQLSGITIVDGAQGSSQLTFTGTESALNAALEGMTFTPYSGFNGAVSLNMTTSLAADLIGHYQFSGDANDSSSGLTQHGTLNGEATTTNDPIRGDVLSLDGSGDFVFIEGLIGEPESITLAAWINASSVDTFGAVVISTGESPALYLEADGRLTGYYESGGANYVITTQESLLGTGWRHVAVSIDTDSQELTLYVDGAAVETIAAIAPIEYDNSPNTYIGRGGDGGTGFDFNGLIDDARIYGRGLSGSEIAALAADNTAVSDTVAIDVTGVNQAPTYFSGSGVQTNFESSTSDAANDLLLQGDGRLIVVGTANDGSGPQVALTRYLEDGTLDTSFGVGGRVITAFSTSDTVNAAALQPDGSIVVVGATNDGNGMSMIARYLSDGTLDTSFDGDGHVTLDIASSSSEYLNDVVVQADGRIVAVGYANIGDEVMSLVRLNADGSLDTSLNGTGIMTFDLVAGDDRANTLAVQDDGKIVIGGQSGAFSAADLAVLRLNIDGSFDTSFNGTGMFVMDVSTVASGGSYTGVDSATAVLIDDNGRIVIGGITVLDNVESLAMRLNSDGTLDTSFNGVGYNVISAGFPFEGINDIALQPDGRLVLVGSSYTSSGINDVSVIRVNTDGTLDTTFNGDGKLRQPIGTATDEATAVVIDRLGNIVVVGRTDDGQVGSHIMRFDSNGNLDNQFVQANSLDGNPTYVEDGLAVSLDVDVEIFDEELSGADDFGGATLTLVRNSGANADDVFSATGNLVLNGGTLELSSTDIGTYTNTGGQLVFTFGAGVTNVQVNEAMQAIQYSNSSDTPVASVQIDWTFDDGGDSVQTQGGTAKQATGSTTVNITATNDAPIFATLNMTINEGASVILGSSNINSIDYDNSAAELTYSVSALTNGQFEYVASPSVAITSFSQADINSGLVRFVHDDGELAPNFQLTVSDGSLTAGPYSPVMNFTNVNDAPTLTIDPIDVEFTEQSPVGIDINISIGDVDDANLESATVQITAGYETGVDSLNWTPKFGISGVFDAPSGTLTFTGTATVADYQTLLRTVSFVNNSDTPDTTTRTIEIVVDDGTNTSTPVARDINVTAVNDEPTTPNASASGPEDTALAITLNGSDVDGTIDSFEISSLPTNGTLYVDAALTDAVIAFNTYAATSEQLTLYFDPDADWTGATTFTFSAVDNQGNWDQTAATATLNITPVNDAPELDLDLDNSTASGVDFNATWTQGAGPVAIADDDAVVSDVEGDSLTTLTVTITNALNSAFETLSADTTGTSITASYDSGTSVLTLSGVDSAANYQQVLRTITYDNSLTNPVETDRSITLQTFDGSGWSTTATTTLSIVNAADAGVTITAGTTTGIDEQTTVSELSVYGDGTYLSEAVALAADGSAVVVWTSNAAQDGDSGTVMGRLIDAQGNPVGTEFVINSTGTGWQSDAGVAMDESGNFVVTWTSWDQDGDSGGIYAQRFDNTGAALGVEFRVNTTTAGSQNYGSITMADNGDFVIAWSGAGAGDTSGVFAQRFDASGAALGGELLINETTANGQDHVGIAADENGNFAVTWTSSGQDGSGRGVYVRLFDATGEAVTSEQLVNTSTSGDQWISSVAMNASGDFVVTWREDGLVDGIYMQLYAADGTASGGEVQVHSTYGGAANYPQAAIDDAGNVTVVWQDVVDSDDYGIVARQFDANGTPLGAQFIVNTHEQWYQEYPAIAMNGDGQFVVVFTDYDANADGEMTVEMRRYGAATTEDGGTATFGFVLDSQPTDDVTIALSMPDGTEGTLSTTLLTFTAANWNIAQVVTVTGVDDALGDGDVTHQLITSNASSADSSYNGLDVRDVNVTNLDNDPFLDLDDNNSAGAGGSNFATSWIEGSGAVAVADIDALVGDADSSTLGSLTVTITNHLDGLAEVLTADTTGTSIVASYDSGTGILTLSGSDTVANYQQVLRTVSYDNASDTPNTTSRVISFVVNDGSNASTIATTTVAVTATNDAPTGIVSIDNTTPSQGDTLNASNTLADPDGLSGVISYQWYRDGVLIGGATGSSYTTSQDDVGGALSVTASYTDDGGASESVSSSATTAVANVNDSVSGQPVITGTPTEDQTLTVDTTGISDVDGLGTFSYQWYRDGVAIGGATATTYTLGDSDVDANVTIAVSYTDGFGTTESTTSNPVGPVANINDAPTGAVTIDNLSPAEGDTLTASNTLADADGLSGAISYQWYRDGVVIGGASAATYVTGQVDVGTAITVVASYIDDQGTAESVTSTATAAVTNVNDPVSGQPVITGTQTEDQTLTAQTGGISDEDGLGVFSFQWYRDGIAVGGATSGTYVLDDADVDSTLTVTVSYTDGYGAAESTTSNATGTIANINDAPTGSVTIDNLNPAEGDTLTVSNTLADADGLSGSISYQWYRDGVVVSGATGTTYVTGQTDVGAAISVVAGYTDDQGTAESVTSAATAVVTNVNNAVSGQPVIVGAATEDETLTIDTSGISDEDGLGSFSYQWFRDGVAVSGASASSYVLDDADVGTNITVAIAYTDGYGAAESTTSNAVGLIANVNDTPTGAVTIDNLTPAQGDTLTASNTLADADGLSGAIGYQWYRDGVAIGSATNTSYVTEQADVGSAITVVVSYIDDQGTTESVTSTATAAVTNVNDAVSGQPVILGTPTEDQTLTIDTSGISDDDGLGTFSYQWYRDGVAIGGATAASLVLGDADVDANITAAVFYTDGQGTAESTTSAAVGPIANINDAPTGAVTIDNLTPAQGDTLTASNTLADADGLSGAIGYQWYRDGVAIGGASSATYVTSQADVGAAISVAASYTDDQGAAESVGSGATAAVANVNDAVTGQPVILGTPTEDQTLTIDNSGISDDDGLGSFSYQWLRDGVAIGGATAASLVLGDADVDANITVAVSFTDAQGTAESTTSAAVGPIANVNDAPVGAVTIDNLSPAQGDTLTASNTLADADGLSGAISYQWYRDGVVIGGATGANYVTEQVDVGAAITALASYTDDQGNPESVLSGATAVVTNVNDAVTGQPVILGTPIEDQTLTIDTSGISDDDGLGTFSYQWYRDGVAIGGATAASLVLGDSDVDSSVTVQVSYTDGQGTPESTISAAVGPIANINDAPTGAVTIDNPFPSQGDMLTASNTLADADGLSGVITYQWYRDGVAIGGASDATYTTGQVDVGAAITVVADYTDDQGTAESVTSAATAAVTNVNDAVNGQPVILGTPTEDQTLTIDTSGISDVDGLGTFNYQWYRDGVAIGGATAASLTLGDADVDANITAEVSYTDGQGAAESTSSAAVGPIANINDSPTGAVTIDNLSPSQGDTLTVSNTLADADGLSGAISYQWYRDGVVIGGATAATYVTEQVDVGTVITALASYTDDQGTPETVLSGATAVVTNVNDAVNGQPVILGTPTEDQTLTIDTSGISDDDGLGTFSYQWYRDGAAIVGATADSLVLGDADVASNISIEVAYTDGLGAAESTASVAVGPIANVNDRPVVTPGLSFNLLENSAIGTLVGRVTATDLDAGTTLGEWRIVSGNSNGEFIIDVRTGEIRVADDSALNFESTPVYALGITVSDGTATSVAVQVTVNLTDLNETPTLVDDLLFTNEDTALVINAADLLANDSDPEAAPLTLVSISQPENGIVLDQLDGSWRYQPNADFSGEERISYRVSDGVNETTAELRLVVNPVNDAPEVLSPTLITLAEDQSGVTTIAIRDAEGDLPIFELTGGADVDRFEVDAASGALRFTSAPDYEAVADANQDNVYELQVTVSDGNGGQAIHALQINLENVNEAPVIEAASISAAATDDNMWLGQLNAIDPDTGDSLVFEITAGNDQQQFQIDSSSGALFRSEADINAGAYQIEVQVTDGSGLSTATVVEVFISNPAGIGSGVETPLLPDDPANPLGDPPGAETTAEPVQPEQEPNSSDAAEEPTKEPETVAEQVTNADSQLLREDFSFDTTGLYPGATEFSFRPPEQPTIEDTQTILPGTQSEHRLAMYLKVTPSEATTSAVTNAIEVLQQITAIALPVSTELAAALDTLAERGSSGDAQIDLRVSGAVAGTVSLSAGFVIWMLRGGSLLASLLASKPMWTEFDPLPVFSGESIDDEQEHPFGKPLKGNNS